MRTVSVQEFDALLLKWARDQFIQELSSDFRRSKQYDGLRAKEQLAVIQNQSPEQLAVLSRVLPLGVFWETPNAIKVRKQLTIEERQPVERLRADYHAEHNRNYNQHMELLRREHHPEIKKLFRSATREGNNLQNKIGKQRNLVVARAGAGEWGFIKEQSWGRVTISINLSRFLTLSYMISIKNNLGETIRFHDHYLGVLGIGGGDWQIDNENEFGIKFIKACEFALWHAGEYEGLINFQKS
jgi:hypothetical protein